MLNGFGDISNLFKLQKEMKNIQKKLKKTEISGESADSKVRAVVNGEYDLVKISIDESLASGNVKQLEKSVVSAVNDAAKKMKDHTAQQMSAVTDGLDLPGLT